MLHSTWHRIAMALSVLVLCIHASASDQTEYADQVVVVKSQHTMTLLSHGKRIKIYRIALGTGDAGPKEHQGDHKTPEGHYIIDSRNPNSRFHLALHISYPNTADKAHPKAQELPPGGNEP